MFRVVSAAFLYICFMICAQKNLIWSLTMDVRHDLFLHHQKYGYQDCVIYHSSLLIWHAEMSHFQQAKVKTLRDKLKKTSAWSSCRVINETSSKIIFVLTETRTQWTFKHINFKVLTSTFIIYFICILMISASKHICKWEQ